MPGRRPAPHRPAPGRHHDAIVTGGGGLTAALGWASVLGTPTRAGPQQRSRLPGLHLAGHWTTPSAGPPWVGWSGYHTAGMVLADSGGHPKWTH